MIGLAARTLFILVVLAAGLDLDGSFCVACVAQHQVSLAGIGVLNEQQQFVEIGLTLKAIQARQQHEARKLEHRARRARDRRDSRGQVVARARHGHLQRCAKMPFIGGSRRQRKRSRGARHERRAPDSIAARRGRRGRRRGHALRGRPHARTHLFPEQTRVAVLERVQLEHAAPAAVAAVSVAQIDARLVVALNGDEKVGGSLSAMASICTSPWRRAAELAAS